MGIRRTIIFRCTACYQSTDAEKEAVQRNQNPLDYSTISRRVWKKWSKHALAIPIGWQPFPNEKQPSTEDQSRQNLGANCAEAFKSFGVDGNKFDGRSS
jgi:hypothetical protein